MYCCLPTCQITVLRWQPRNIVAYSVTAPLHQQVCLPNPLLPRSRGVFWFQADHAPFVHWSLTVLHRSDSSCNITSPAIWTTVKDVGHSRNHGKKECIILISRMQKLLQSAFVQWFRPENAENHLLYWYSYMPPNKACFLCISNVFVQWITKEGKWMLQTKSMSYHINSQLELYASSILKSVFTFKE